MTKPNGNWGILPEWALYAFLVAFWVAFGFWWFA